jgi:O-antigen/teichoic acid export membrane protein
MVTAVSRHHFEARNDLERARVWWTGLSFVGLLAVVVLVPALLFRDALAAWTLGPTIREGGFYCSLVFVNCWVGVVGSLLNSHLRVQKRSTLSVAINLGCLLLNICLNVSLLVFWQMGIPGILWGNLITGIVTTACLLAIFSQQVGSYRFHKPLLLPLWRFGAPLVVTALLSLLLRQADRYFLRIFSDMDSVGIYSLAYAIGQGINTLYMSPFSMSWNVVLFEIAQQPDAKEVYARVFQYYFYGLVLVMLGASFFAKPALAFVVPQNYLAAADLIPIICLAYLFFSLHEHFRVPVILAKKTTNLLPVLGIATLVNLGLNLLLIPSFGPTGAAWASVVSFAVFSFTGLWRYRAIDRYEYPLGQCGVVLTGMVISYCVIRKLETLWVDSAWPLVIAGGIWLAWAIILLGPLLRKVFTEELRIFMGYGRLVLGRHR